MKNKNYLIGVVTFFIVGLGVFSCQKENSIKQDLDSELNSFLSSNEFYQLKKNFNIKADYLDFEYLRKESYPEANVNVFYLPIRKKGRTLGKLAIFSKEKGRKYRTLFEDLSNINNMGGIITIYTSKKQFVVDFDVKSVNNNLQASINNVNDFSTFLRRSELHANSEFPTSDDGWWSCTTNCYKIAKDACDDDASCKFICDLLGLGSYCTISISTACSIYCL